MIVRIPELIRKHIKEHKMTQKDFAEDVGISETALSRILNSRQTQIDLRTLEKLHGKINLDYGNLILVEEDFEPEV